MQIINWNYLKHLKLFSYTPQNYADIIKRVEDNVLFIRKEYGNDREKAFWKKKVEQLQIISAGFACNHSGIFIPLCSFVGLVICIFFL